MVLVVVVAFVVLQTVVSFVVLVLSIIFSVRCFHKEMKSNDDMTFSRSLSVWVRTASHQHTEEAHRVLSGNICMLETRDYE